MNLQQNQAQDQTWVKQHAIVIPSYTAQQPSRYSVEAGKQDEQGSQWISELDPKTGRAYYWNSKTGASQWERPKSDQNRSSSPWITEFDSTTGQTYYWNVNTHESRWERPQLLPDQVRVKPASLSKSAYIRQPKNGPRRNHHRRNHGAQHQLQTDGEYQVRSRF